MNIALSVILLLSTILLSFLLRRKNKHAEMATHQVSVNAFDDAKGSSYCVENSVEEGQVQIRVISPFLYDI